MKQRRDIAYVEMSFDEYTNFMTKIPEDFPYETGNLSQKDVLLITFFKNSFVGIEFPDKYEAGLDYEDDCIFVRLDLDALAKNFGGEIRGF